MNIAIFHSDTNKTMARTIGSMIGVHASNVMYHELERVSDRFFCRNPASLFENTSHALFLFTPEEDAIPSFVFYAGYCLGRGIRVIMIESDPRFPVPENFRQFGVMLKPELIAEYIVAEKERYQAEAKRKRARKELLDRGISCFEENFVFVVNAGNSEAVELFLEAGFSPSMVDARGVSLLSIAVRAQLPDIASRLIAAGADVDRQSDDRGYSPLMDAAQKGDPVMLSLLLSAGAKPDLRSKDGQTALIICAGRGDVAMSKLLIEAGADPEIKDHLGMSAARYASLFGNADLTALFNTPPA
jgi:hypothetical protein